MLISLGILLISFIHSDFLFENAAYLFHNRLIFY